MTETIAYCGELDGRLALGYMNASATMVKTLLVRDRIGTRVGNAKGWPELEACGWKVVKVSIQRVAP